MNEFEFYVGRGPGEIDADKAPHGTRASIVHYANTGSLFLFSEAGTFSLGFFHRDHSDSAPTTEEVQNIVSMYEVSLGRELLMEHA
jgi:hypothetical protein